MSDGRTYSSQQSPPHQGRDWNACLREVAENGNSQSFMDFYDYFAPRLTQWLAQMAADQELAEDLCQEALLQAWNNVHRFDPSKASASTWLYTIARNLFIDHHRKHKNRRKYEDKLLQEQAESKYDTDTALLDNQHIKPLIKQLPHRQAQVIYQSFYLGRSHQEISQAMDLPLGSVKSSLRLAFQKLYKSFKMLS